MRFYDIDDALVRRLAEMDAARTAGDAGRALHRVPSAIEARRFGDAVALRDPSHPEAGYYNRVVGFGPRDLGRIDAIVAFYEEAGIPCQLDLTPNHLAPELMTAARALGFEHHGGMTVLHGIPEAAPPAESGPSIERVTLDTVDAALDVRAGGSPRPIDPEMREKRRALYVARPDFTLYLARLDSAPAAVLSVFDHDRAAHLANAVTAPSHRRRGLGAALLRHALDEAARRGCTLATTDVMYGTTSHRNAERVGLRIAYQTAWWVRPLARRA